MRTESIFKLFFAGTIVSLFLTACGGGRGEPPPSYVVSGTAQGLQGSGLVLELNGGNATTAVRLDVSISASGSFSFPSPVQNGTAFTVTVKTPPSNPDQVCGVSYFPDYIDNGPFTNLSVRCVVPVGFAYVANATSNNISGYARDSTGLLTPVLGFPIAAGLSPYSIAADPLSRFVYVANYGFGANSISAFTVNAASGALVPIPGSPFAAGTKPRFVTVHPTGKYLYAVNESDNTVSAYAINATSGILSAVPGSPFSTGANPGAMAVDASGLYAFVTNRGTNNLSVFTIGVVDGALTPVPGAPFATGKQPVSVVVDRQGKFVYVANYESETISAYQLDRSIGTLGPIAGSPISVAYLPTSLSMDPTNRFVFELNALFGGSSGEVFAVDATTGVLTSLGVGTTPVANAMAFDARGQFAYFLRNNTIAAYSFDSATGATTHISAWPLSWQDAVTGDGPISVAITNN